jgi:UDP-glucose 4-epimerase
MMAADRHAHVGAGRIRPPMQTRFQWFKMFLPAAPGACPPAPDSMSLHIVTGAAGFIGSHLTDAILARGCRVIGIDDLSLGTRSNLEQTVASERFTLVVADLNAVDDVCRQVDVARAGMTIDTLWHLAANSDIQAGVADADVDLTRTFLTTYSALRLCRRFGIRNVVFASTSAVYGELPGPLTEDAGPLFPISNYGAMKLASEAALSAALTDVLEWLAIVRFPNVVGSRSTHGAVHDFLAKLAATPERLVVLGDGTQQKPYLHVADLVRAMLHIRDRAPGPIAYYNVGDGKTSTSVADIARIVIDRASPGAEIAYTGGSRGWAGDVPRFQYDTTKIESLGWRPSMTSSEAITRAVDELAAAR